MGLVEVVCIMAAKAHCMYGVGEPMTMTLKHKPHKVQVGLVRSSAGWQWIAIYNQSDQWF